MTIDASSFDSKTQSNALNQLFELGFQTSVYLRVQCGLSCHQWDLTAATVSCFHLVSHIYPEYLSKVLKGAKRLYVSNILYAPCIVFIKLSILFQLKRIFTTAMKGVAYWTMIALMWINTLFYLVFGIVQIFYCSPIPKSWKPSIPGHCQNISSGLVFSPVIDFVLNVAMLLLPIWIVWHLEMKIEQKLRAGLIFVVGLLLVYSLSSLSLV